MPLWGSAFAKPTAELMKRFNDSFRFDRQWYDEDIRGSMVYAQAIQRLGLISADELKQILDGLARVRDEFDGGTFVALPSDEDIQQATAEARQGRCNLQAPVRCVTCGCLAIHFRSVARQSAPRSGAFRSSRASILTRKTTATFADRSPAWASPIAISVTRAERRC